MQIGFKRGAPARLRLPLLCVPLVEGEKLRGGWLGELDAACGGVLGAVARSGDFTGRLGSQTLIYNPRPGGPRRILLLGVGSAESVDLERVRQTAARAVKRGAELGADEIGIVFPARLRQDVRTLAVALTEGCALGDYRFDKYLSAARDKGKRGVQSVTFVAVTDADAAAAAAGIRRGLILGEAVCKARDMVNAPANELTPTEMANRAAASAKQYGYRAEILEHKDMAKLGMGGTLAVCKGSDQPPRFIVLEWAGANPKSQPYVIVGKGLTFDAGGICLKPAPKMDEMKGDMAGGATVLGTLEAAARLKVPARVIGLVPATENLLGASAYRPGDILKMMNGKTVYVDNTDAEGRLILSDGLVYAQRFKPRSLIDLATLTGAVLVALGQVATAILSNDKPLVQELMASGDRTFERLWELPLWEEFDELIKSPLADIKNTGGKYGGTITAAAFLKHFVGNTPWAHLDIAGTAFLDKADGYRPAGGTGVGVRLLVDYFEHGGVGAVEAAAAAPVRAAATPRKAARGRKSARGSRRAKR